MAITYEVQKLIDGDWVTINTINVPSTVLDADLLRSGEVRACYRVIAYSSGFPDRVSTSNELCINLLPQIWMPNAFSPDNNNLNDSFYPVLVGITHFEMQVFDRWGQQIFQAENQAWTGKLKGGKPAPAGVYLLLYTYKSAEGERVHKKQTLTLIK